MRNALSLIVLTALLLAGLATVLQLPAKASDRSAAPMETSPTARGMPCAHDVEARLTSTHTLMPRVMGFNTASLLDPDRSEHLQGIARFEWGGTSYLFVSQSRKGRNPGILATVEMASLDEGVWDTNRAPGSRGVDGWYGAPPPSDRVIAVKRDEGFSQYSHPGGMAIFGNILAIAMEGAHDETIHPRGRVDFYRIESPTSLRLINAVANSGQHASSVAFTQLADGRYLLAISDNTPKNIRLYRSTGTEAFGHHTTFEQVAVFSEKDLAPGDNNFFQNLDFLTDCASGRLYLVLAFQDHDLWGLVRKNRLARYEISGADDTPALRRLGVQKVSCQPPFGGKICSFDASFGAYVTAHGALAYYASESANTGPDGSVSFGAFAP